MKYRIKRYDSEAVQKLFQLQPDNRLTPAQMVRRAIFPRWEVITPALFDPIQQEDRRILELLTASQEEQLQTEHPER